MLMELTVLPLQIGRSSWTNSGLCCMAWPRFTWIVLPHSIPDVHETV
jgi:hypothetical protein